MDKVIVLILMFLIEYQFTPFLMAETQKESIDSVFSLYGKNLAFDDIISSALKTNPEILSKHEIKSSYDSAVESAKWQYAPTPSIRMNYESKNNVSEQYVATIDQPIWTGGRISANVEEAKNRSKMASDDIYVASENIAIELASLYQNYMQSTYRISAIESSLKYHNEQLNRIKKRESAGVSSSSDVLLVISRINQIQAEKLQTNLSLSVVKERIFSLSGIIITDQTIKSGMTDTVNNLKENDYIQISVHQSPELKKIKSEKAAYESQLEKIKSTLYPQVNLKGEYYFGEERGLDNDRKVMLVVSYSPGAGLSSLSDIDSQKYKIKSIEQSMHYKEQLLKQKVSAEYSAMVFSHARVIELMENRRNVIGILDSYNRQFDAGKRSWLDVLNQARELMTLEFAIAESYSLMNSSYIKLKIFKGDYW